MEGGGIVVAGALLFALFLGVVAVLLWQEVRRGSFRTTPLYVVEEAVPFVHRRLPAETRARLGEEDVASILEWELRYLTGGGSKVAGGPEAVRAVLRGARRVQGISYREEDVRAVLAGEAEYLTAIGAVGDPVEDEGSPASRERTG